MAANRNFIEISAGNFDNYCTMETVQLIFEKNLDYRQFVYIFQDLWNYAAPHSERLEKNLDDAFKLRVEDDKLFLDEL